MTKPMCPDALAVGDLTKVIRAEASAASLMRPIIVNVPLLMVCRGTKYLEGYLRYKRRAKALGCERAPAACEFL